jgi:hypothetical protein
MSVHDRFTHTKRMILFGLLIPWSVAMIIGVTGAADHSRLFSTIGVVAVVLPFGRLWYGEPSAIANAIGYAKFFGWF